MSTLLASFPADVPDFDLSFLDQDPLNLFPVEHPFAISPEQIGQYYAQDYAAAPAITPNPPTVHQPAKPQKCRRRTNLSRREHSLERNRVAASKCRQKKRDYTNSLETRCSALAENRARLEHERSELWSQMLSLKNELLRHALCNDDRVGEYLERMMQQLTQADCRRPSVSVLDSDRHYLPGVLSQRSHAHRTSIVSIAPTTSDSSENPDAWSIDDEFDELIKV